MAYLGASPIADSVALTGNPTAPTATPGDDDTSVATTGFVAAAIAAISGGGVPAGVLVPYGGTIAPADWLLCYGQAVNRTTYSTLFAVIATTYGAGDGSTTFNVPDLRGRVIAGQDNMGGVSANRLTNQTGGLDGDVLGTSGGSETHTLTSAQIATHTHGVSGSTGTESANHTHAGGGTVQGVVPELGGSIITGFDRRTDGVESGTVPVSGSTGIESVAHTHSFSVTSGSAGSGTAHNNVQPTFILNYIIKT